MRNNSVGLACDVWRLEDQKEFLQAGIATLERQLSALRYKAAAELKVTLKNCCIYVAPNPEGCFKYRDGFVWGHGGASINLIRMLDRFRESAVDSRHSRSLQGYFEENRPFCENIYRLGKHSAGEFSLQTSLYGVGQLKSMCMFVYVPTIGWCDYRWRKLHDGRRVRAALVIQRWWSRLLYTRLRARYLLDDIAEWREKFDK